MILLNEFYWIDSLIDSAKDTTCRLADLPDGLIRVVIAVINKQTGFYCNGNYPSF
jgi:hypothetical protein